MLRADPAGEDRGWLLTVIDDATTDRNELCVLHAGDVTGPEVARIQLPRRGNSLPDGSVAAD